MNVNRALRLLVLGIVMSGVVWLMISATHTSTYRVPWKRQVVRVTPIQRVIVERARQEVTRGVSYDASYRQLPYPNGDVPSDRGACTDVIVRALRAAGYDLQKLIHEDKQAHPRAYPRIATTSGIDSHIDHRRTPNHMAYLKRHALVLPIQANAAHAAEWQPGDLVYVRLFGGTLHCGVVSDRVNANGIPLLIHNLGPVASEDDSLRRWTILGHFRFPVSSAKPPNPER